MINIHKQPLVLANILLILVFSLLVSTPANAYTPHKRLLIFIPYENYNHTQLSTLTQQLSSAGYTIDTVSSTPGVAHADNQQHTATVPTTTSPTHGAITPGHTTIATITSDTFANSYDGLILIGGIGAPTYFYDGLYTQTTLLGRETIASAATAINNLVQTVLEEKLLLAGIGNGTGLIAYCREPGTTGTGANNLGTSILAGQLVTADTTDTILTDNLTNLNITILTTTPHGNAEPIVITGPGHTPHHILTVRDDSNTTLTYAARTFLNMLQTYPNPATSNTFRRVLVFGGDTPQRYNIPPHLLATEDAIANMLTNVHELPIEAIATSDEHLVNTALALPRNTEDTFDALIYLRKYATGNQTTLNETIRSYVQQGGMLIVLHQGLYNDAGLKGNLTTLSGLIGLIGGEIPDTTSNEETIYPGPHYFLNTNLGHYISTHNVATATLKTYTNTSHTTIGNANTVTNSYFTHTINPDELLTSIQVNPSAQTTPLFANNYLGKTIPIGWTRTVGNGTVFVYEPGIRIDSSLALENKHIILNALRWGTKPNPHRTPPASHTTATPTPTSAPKSTAPAQFGSFEAKWISQTQGTGSGENAPHLLKPGESVTIEAVFQNTGDTTWYNDTTRDDYIGFYVYKDPLYSTPLSYNDPTNANYGSSYFFSTDWGPSFNQQTSYARAALLQESAVAPGELGHFLFSFHAPTDAVPNANQDDPSTLHSEYYYREDLTLAYGPNWMTNRTNGDPWKRAHVWFPLRVIP